MWDFIVLFPYHSLSFKYFSSSMQSKSEHHESCTDIVLFTKTTLVSAIHFTVTCSFGLVYMINEVFTPRYEKVGIP